MQVWRSTSTMPSARLNEAPVGQTSTQGGSAQCWHMTGAEIVLPLFRSFRSTLRIHCESVERVVPGSPFSRLQASTQSRAAARALRGVDEHAPAHLGAGRLARGLGLRIFVEHDARRDHRAGDRGGLAEELAPALVDGVHRGIPVAAAAVVAGRAVEAWQSKQSSFTAA